MRTAIFVGLISIAEALDSGSKRDEKLAKVIAVLVIVLFIMDLVEFLDLLFK
jgi:hypothetical protein